MGNKKNKNRRRGKNRIRARVRAVNQEKKKAEGNALPSAPSNLPEEMEVKIEPVDSYNSFNDQFEEAHVDPWSNDIKEETVIAEFKISQENNSPRSPKKTQEIVTPLIVKSESDTPQLPGLRLIDLRHFITQIQRATHDSLRGCSIEDMVFVKEFYKDYAPAIQMKCSICEKVSDFTYKLPSQWTLNNCT